LRAGRQEFAHTAHSAIPSFFRHSGEGQNPSFSCDLGIAKEREARALFTGFLLSQEWQGGLYSLDVRRVFARTVAPE